MPVSNYEVVQRNEATCVAYLAGAAWVCHVCGSVIPLVEKLRREIFDDGQA